LTCELNITLVPCQKFLDEYPARIMESQGLQPKCCTNYWEAGPVAAGGAVVSPARGADNAASQASHGEDDRSGAGGCSTAVACGRGRTARSGFSDRIRTDRNSCSL